MWEYGLSVSDSAGWPFEGEKAGSLLHFICPACVHCQLILCCESEKDSRDLRSPLIVDPTGPVKSLVKDSGNSCWECGLLQNQHHGRFKWGQTICISSAWRRNPRSTDGPVLCGHRSNVPPNSFFFVSVWWVLYIEFEGLTSLTYSGYLVDPKVPPTDTDFSLFQSVNREKKSPISFFKATIYV